MKTGDCVVKGCTKVRVGYRINDSFYCQEHYQKRLNVERELHVWKDKPMKCAQDGCDKVGRDRSGTFYCADHYVQCSVDGCTEPSTCKVNGDPYCDEHVAGVEPDFVRYCIRCGTETQGKCGSCSNTLCMNIDCVCGCAGSEPAVCHLCGKPNVIWDEHKWYCKEHLASKGNSVIDHPAHYNTGDIEVVDAIMDWGLNFNLGCAVKHTARAGKKEPSRYVEDLEKAVRYLQFEIEWEKKHGRG